MLTGRRAAFTLVELLVVIGIIAVLAGILFPVFTHALGKRWQIRCAANMRQVHTALMAYCEDYGGYLPPASLRIPGGTFVTPWNEPFDIVWWDSLLPYAGSREVFYCPSVPPNRPRYRINAKLTFLEPGRLDDCTEPSATICLVEGSVPLEPTGAIFVPASIGVDPESTGNALRHSGKMNVCFADGHVKLLSIGDLLKGSPLWEVEKPLE